MIRGRRFVHRHEPLIGQHRLDDLAGAPAARHHHPVRLLFGHEPRRTQVREHRLARHVAVEAPILRRGVVVDLRFQREDFERFETMPPADLVVIEIVRGGDLHGARAERLIDGRIGKHRDATAGQRQLDLFADKTSVTLVVGIDRDGNVAEHRFGPRGGDRDKASAVDERIADLPELADFLFLLHLEIGNRGAEHRIPVHQPLASIDEPVVVESHECLDDGAGQALVHGKALARPIARCAEAPHLVGDRRARLFLPRPDPLDEWRAPQVAARPALGLELILDHDLRGDAGVIGAHLPKRVVAAHPMPADEHIHQRLLERVPHVQRAGDVRGRKLDAERFCTGLHRRLEQPVRFPPGVPLAFDRARLVAFREFHRLGP